MTVVGHQRLGLGLGLWGLIWDPGRVGVGTQEGWVVCMVFSITELMDKCKSCILIGYTTRGLIVIVNLHLLTFLLPFLSDYSSWVILKQLDPFRARNRKKILPTIFLFFGRPDKFWPAICIF